MARTLRPVTVRRLTAALLAGSALTLGMTACSDPTATTGAAEPASAAGGTTAGATAAAAEAPQYNLSADQDRIRTEASEELAAAVPADVAADGKLTVGTTTATAPLTFVADDNATPIGVELDIAQLVADKLGLELDVQVTSWENWPLKVETGEYEVIHSNVGINDERLQKFDFASYRGAYMGFSVPKGSGLVIEEPADVAGLRIAVGAGTNQERILTEWNAQLEAEGQEPAVLSYYANDADTLLALGAGRIDAYLSPLAGTTYTVNTRDDLEIGGTINAGWPDETLVAATTLRGSGLIDPYSAALAEIIDEGTYDQVLQRWHLEQEAVDDSHVYTADDPEGRAPAL
jgi:polar amino acid transport system substrate-binding protein